MELLIPNLCSVPITYPIQFPVTCPGITWDEWSPQPSVSRLGHVIYFGQWDVKTQPIHHPLAQQLSMQLHAFHYTTTLSHGNSMSETGAVLQAISLSERTPWSWTETSQASKPTNSTHITQPKNKCLLL